MRLIHAFVGLVGVGLSATACASAPPPAPSAAPSVLTPAEIARRSNASVVMVKSAHGFGTGFVVAKDRIATNFHVVEGTKALVVVLADGTKRPVTGLWLPEQKRDIAVLQVDTTGLAPLSLADTAALPGEHVIAVGNPNGLDHTVSDGIVGGLRTMDQPNSDFQGSFVQHSAPISPGSSGGPLFNDRGQVVGLNTFFLRNAENLNFAVATSELAPLVREKGEPIAMTEFAKWTKARGTGGACFDEKQPNLNACLAECDAGKSTSCGHAGYLVRLGIGTMRDDSRAMALYRRACEGGDGQACSNMGGMYRFGEAIAKDAAKASAIYRDACDRAVPHACRYLAQMTSTGEGVPASPARALSLYALACDGKLGDACLEGGALAEKTKGPHHLEKVTSFYQRACDHGSAQGCTKLGTLLIGSRGVALDEARAVRLFERACEKHDPEACGRYGAALVEGKGITADREGGLKKLRWACHNGAGASCEKLAALEKR